MKYDTYEIDLQLKILNLNMKVEFIQNTLKFSIINIGRKNNNHNDDVIEDIIFLLSLGIK